ncbi:MAG: hypothetical protein IT458_05230 [Planctomycetes bacterium]|nr:hypothetical protein [Planctomycetota bacterium]
MVYVSILDLNGFLLGVALGLRELGHRVAYHSGDEGLAADHTVTRMRRDLVAQRLGPQPGGPDPDADLLVVCDAFADQLRAAAAGLHDAAPFDPAHPLRPSLNPCVRGARAAVLGELLARARGAAVVVDGSDACAPRPAAFDAIPGLVRLAREVEADAAPGGWLPFPFLYHPVVLWMEYLRPRSEWFVPLPVRLRRWEWVFCGTLSHPRYGGRRAAAVRAMEQRFPRARGLVMPEGCTYDRVLAALQSTGSGLDLPGAGELCFRLHEYLALAVPIVRLEPFSHVVPEGLQRLLRATPEPELLPTPEDVLATYAGSYAPRFAARVLLRAAGAGAGSASRAPVHGARC